MSSGGDDAEPAAALPKKRGRGPTKLTRVVNKPGKEVKFDKLGRPIINENTTSYPSTLGTVVRANVPVSCKDWSDVPDYIKLKMWQQIMMEWNLPDNERLQKEVYSRMAVHYRRFRSTLTKQYFEEGKTPFNEFSTITQADWDEFVKYHQSEEFQELSEKGKANQSKNKYYHYLGSRGYSGEKFQNRLKEALQDISKEQEPSAELSSQGSTSELSQEQFVQLSVQYRHVSWKLAREKVSKESQERVYPNLETKAIIETIEENEAAFKQGMMTIERYDDVLGNSLPNREHSGRVRGVGTLVGIRRTYEVCGKRKRNTSSESEASINERIQREVEERVNREVEERMKPFMEQMAFLMSQRQMDIDSPRTDQSSCQSVHPPHFLDSIEGEHKCKLYLVRDGRRIQVAVGIVHSYVEGTVIHGRPLPPGHAKVMVDDYVAGEEDTLVPVPNDEVVTLRSAKSSFTAWPKDMISLEEELSKELQVSTGATSVHSQLLARRRYTKFDGLNFDKLGVIFKKLRDQFLKQTENKFLVEVPLDLFHCDDSIYIHADDLADLITPETRLGAPIIQIFLMYVHKFYHDLFPNELVGFMDPVKTCYNNLNGDAQEQEYADNYIRKSLKENRDKKIIFIPYHQSNHWVLVVLHAWESMLYVFDSDQKHKKNLKIIKALEEPYRMDRCIGGHGKSAKLKVTHIKCPQQFSDWECGYYVMLFVHNIITHYLDVFPNLKDFSVGYNEGNIDQIRLEWGKFLLKEVLVEKSKTI